MKRILTKFLLIILSVSLIGVNQSACAASPRPAVTARSAIIYDPSYNKVIYAKNIHTKRPAASLVKIMTAMVVLDHIDINKKVRVSKKASLAQPSKVYLRTGEYYRVKDLLYALLLNSGNDSAVCLAEAVSGSEWNFVQLMNKKAQRIGAYRTRFINASGLPGKGQYSTAYDMALIMKNAAKYSFIRNAMGHKVHTIRRSNGKKIRLRNHNKLLWNYSKHVIGKTGYTCAAGKCYVGYATYGKRKVIICVLKSRTMWSDSRKLLDYTLGKDNKQLISVNKKLHNKTTIRKIQRALHRAGYSPGKVDGIFGYKTLRAVFQFQSARGLKADGIVGPKTLGKLEAYV